MSAKNFLDFFPVPRFLEMPATGLCLSDECISFLKLEESSKGLIPKFYGTECLPDGVVVQGELKKPEELVKKLKSIKDKYKILFANTALPEEKSYVYRAEVPKVEGANIRDAIEATLSENVPLAPDEAVFDYDIVSSDPNSEKVKVVVYVLSKAIISVYTSTLEEAGIIPLSLEVESQAISKSVVPSEDKEVNLILNINSKRAGLYVVISGVPQFASTLRFDKESNSKPGQRVSGTVHMATLIEEIQRVISYWNGDDRGSGKISKILLCGGLANDLEIQNKISNSFEVSVSTANVWSNAFSLDEHIPQITFEDSFKLAPVIGLALPKKY